MIRRHFLERFLGTTPSGLMVRFGNGGEGNGPAVLRALHSVER